MYLIMNREMIQVKQIIDKIMIQVKQIIDKMRGYNVDWKDKDNDPEGMRSNVIWLANG